MSEELTKKISDLGEKITKARDIDVKKNEEAFQKVADETATLLEEIATLKKGNEKQNDVIKELETLAARSPVGTKIEVVENKEYRELLDRYLRKKGDVKMNDITEKALDWAIDNSKALPLYVGKDSQVMIKKDVIEGINPQGGFWILPEHSPKTVDKVWETNPLRDLANVQTTNTNLVKVIVDDNLATSGGWVGEIEERTSTDTARIGEVNVPIHEQFAEP